MKEYWCAFLSLLFIMVFFTACKNETPAPSSENTDLISRIMENPGEYPQLTKEEFLEITKHYLETNEWKLSFEKACFHTYGVNYSAYIIENEYLFSLHVEVNLDGSAEYDSCLSHYVDGTKTESENDPLLFGDFLN